MADEMVERNPSLCIIGDVHGHLQLGLCIAARWQQTLKVTFDAVLLCGDVGTFTDESQLDKATRRYAKLNPCEVEFLYQWSVTPQPRWISKIFASEQDDGLGLQCPVIMVHGNHEGFAHLATLKPDRLPKEPVTVCELPPVDSFGYIRYLPSGWKCTTKSGIVIGGIGGIERGQRRVQYHDLAYLDEEAIMNLLESGRFDVMITHQGPRITQGNHGSSLLDLLLEERACRYWFHGHTIFKYEIIEYGGTTVVPMGSIAFPVKGFRAGEPGEDGWCCLRLENSGMVQRKRPDFWQDFKKEKWIELPNGQLVAPPLVDAL
jgi:hypothetical protein